MPAEIDRVLGFCLDMLKAFGFENFHIFLSTRPEKSVGDPAQWASAEAALRSALENRGLPFDVDEGGGAFYGPKIDIKIKDALDREWQCSTIQFDFNLRRRFDVNYTGSDGQEHPAYMVHRALLGSMERFFATLIEHYAGDFPVWLAPVQVQLIPITDGQIPYAQEIKKLFMERGIRVEADLRDEKMGAKIRDAEMMKIPYMLVLGRKEMEARSVAVRSRKKGDEGALPLQEFAEKLLAEIAARQ